MEKRLNGEYAAIHSGYWMSFGIVNCFASVFLLERGYSNGDIGMILAMANVVAVVLQPVMADLSDRSQRFSLFGVSQISILILMFFSIGALVLQGKSAALTFVYIMMLAWIVALQPLFNSLAFKLEEMCIRDRSSSSPPSKLEITEATVVIAVYRACPFTASPGRII